MASNTRISLAEKFANKYEAVPWSGCWIWTGHIDKDGYGQIAEYIKNTGKRTGLRAHRASYKLHVGSIPDGLTVLHSCDVRCCVNPAHLSLGTNGDNCRDAIRKGRAPQMTKRFTREARLAHKRAHYHSKRTPELLAKKRAYHHNKKAAQS